MKMRKLLFIVVLMIVLSVSTVWALDTDKDGIPDDWERTQGLDPNNPSDAAKDHDNDGCNNLQEYLNYLHNKDKTALEIASLIGDRVISCSYLEGDRCTRWFYPWGVTSWGLIRLSDVSGNPDYMDFACNSFDYYISNDNVSCREINDSGAMAHAVLEAYKRRPEQRYKEVIRSVSNFYENDQPRGPDGVLCYVHTPGRRAIWIDTLFMVCPLMSKSAEILQEPQRHDWSLNQVFNITARLQDPQVKLYYQGWGWGLNRTGHSPGFWSRGNGWVLMAMTELLKATPINHPEYSKLLCIYKESCKAVLKSQGRSEMWHQLMTRHDSFEETSGSAMFIYSFIEGYKNGWLTREYVDAALKGFDALKCKIDKQGNIYGTCIGTGPQDTLEDYYKRQTPVNDTHGIGPVILAASAVASLDTEFKTKP